MTVGPGWQFVRLPFASFVPNPFYGGANELALDPASLHGVQFNTSSSSSVAVPFDFCVYGISFY